MKVNRESVAGGELQTNGVSAGLARIAVQHGQLHPRVEARRCEVAPTETAARHQRRLAHVHWSGGGQRLAGHRGVEGDTPLAVDLSPDRDVIAGVGSFSLRRIVRLGVSAVLCRHGGTHDFDLRRSPLQFQSRRLHRLGPHPTNCWRSGGRPNV